MSPLSSLVSLALLICQTQALYFYIDGPTQKCFFEELPKDTLVVGMFSSSNWSDSRERKLTGSRHIQSDAMERAVPQLQREL